MPTATARPKHPGQWLAVFIAVYFALSMIAVELRTGLSDDATFWGLAGLTAAVVAQAPRPWNRAVVAAVVATSAVVSLTMGVSTWTALGFALANGAQALVAGEVLRRRLPQGRRIVRLRDISWLVVAALAGGLVGAGLGGLTQLATLGSLGPSTLGTWFMATLAGTLVGAPVFLALFSIRAEPPPVPQWVPTFIAGASTAIVVIVSIWASAATSRNFSYLVIVPVMVSAVWLGQRHTALLVGGLAVSLAAATSRGIGPFAATESMFDPLMAAQLFMCVVQLTALTVGVEASRRRDVIAELDAILSATVEGVFVIDDTGTIRHTNAGAEFILGAAEGELIGMKLASFVREEVGDEKNLHLSRARRVDGSEFWAETSRGEIFEGSGRRRVAVVVRDVTGRIETEESVRRIQDEFVSNMTHELKTPLTAIIGFSDWMLGDPDTPNADADVEVIRDSALAMQELIDDILDFKRVASSEGTREPVDLRSVIEASAEAVARAALDQSIEMRVNLIDGPAVLGDEDQLQSAIQNLLSNAVKYSRAGGRVMVRLRSDGGNAVVTVEDDGIGISLADQERLFERFFRAGNTGEIRGTGLGLALVRQVVERHGGTVDLVSGLGEGTTVTLRLPAITDRISLTPESVAETSV